MITIIITGADTCRQDLLSTSVTNHLRSCGHYKGVDVKIGSVLGDSEKLVDMLAEGYSLFYDLSDFKQAFRAGFIAGQLAAKEDRKVLYYEKSSADEKPESEESLSRESH